MPDGAALLLGVTVLVALGLDLTSGFHDSAATVATAAASRALPARGAMALVAVLTVAGAVAATRLLHTGVASTVGMLVAPAGTRVGLGMIVAALVAAGLWNVAAWRANVPSSPLHALVGALVGMGLAGYGPHALQLDRLVPVLVALAAAPLAALAVAHVATVALLHALRRARPRAVSRGFRIAGLASTSLVALGHGADDAQKTMGVIVLALVSSGHLAAGPGETFPEVPLWVVLTAGSALAAGSLTGSRRAVRSMVSRLVRVEPLDAFDVQVAAAAVVFGATRLAVPVSTAHALAGGVLGADAARHLGRVRWRVARGLLGAWALTMPATAAMAAALASAVRALGG